MSDDPAIEPPTPRAHVLKRILIALVLLLGFLPRLALARLGHNWDMGSWTLAADLVLAGKSVYVETYRYNYGPIWFEILAALRWLQIHLGARLHMDGPEAFHLFIAAFLSLVDIAIAAILARRAGLLIGLIFLFCPVSVFITGFHSQFDNLAILLGLCAWVILLPCDATIVAPSLRRALAAGALLGLSLATKHLLIFFPLWLLMAPRFIPRRPAIVIALLAYSIFAISFLPFATSPPARQAIADHVFNYRSQVNDGALFTRVIDLFVPFSLLDLPARYVPILPGGLMVLFLAALLITGRLIAIRRPHDLFTAYLLAIVIFSFAWADQYLAIPLLAVALLRRHWSAWLYVLTATLVLVMSPNYFGVLGGQDLLFDLVGFRKFVDYHAEIWLIPLLLKDWLPQVWRETVQPAIRGGMHTLWAGSRGDIAK